MNTLPALFLIIAGLLFPMSAVSEQQHQNTNKRALEETPEKKAVNSIVTAAWAIVTDLGPPLLQGLSESPADLSEICFNLAILQERMIKCFAAANENITNHDFPAVVGLEKSTSPTSYVFKTDEMNAISLEYLAVHQKKQTFRNFCKKDSAPKPSIEDVRKAVLSELHAALVLYRKSYTRAIDMDKLLRGYKKPLVSDAELKTMMELNWESSRTAGK
jgi:hypothetical protein